AQQQSWIRVEIDRIPQEDFAELEKRLREVLDYVAAAARDSQAMAGRAKDIAAELSAQPPRPELASEAEAAADPLNSLAGQFSSVGYRGSDYTGDGEEATRDPTENTSLRVAALRPRVKSPLRRAAAPNALEPHALVPTQAHSRPRVIRSS